MNPVETILAKLAELMAEDHVFVDAVGHSVPGCESMRAGLILEFRAYADNQRVYEILAKSSPR